MWTWNINTKIGQKSNTKNLLKKNYTTLLLQLDNQLTHTITTILGTFRLTPNLAESVVQWFLKIKCMYTNVEGIGF